MVKSYLKFEHSHSFGQICSVSANIVWDPWISGVRQSPKTLTGRALVGANEDVISWDLKKAEISDRWRVSENVSPVTCIVRSQADPDVFAVGYEDGKIRLWDSQTATVILCFNGHKSAVTQLQFDGSGVRLVSGGKDTDIILWDLVGEVGLFKLKGHKDQITSLNFLSSNDDVNTQSNIQSEEEDLQRTGSDTFLLSTGKDSLIKIWDLNTQHCIETHIAQSNGECWSLGLSPDTSGCITGGNDGELTAWIINKIALNDQSVSATKILQSRGTFYRNGRDKTVAISFHPNKNIVAIHGSEKSVELWRIRSEEEVQKSLARKRKRKNQQNGVTHDTNADGISVKQVLYETADITEFVVPYLIIRTSGKVRSVDWSVGKSAQIVSILVATTNNQLETFEVTTSATNEKADYNRIYSIDVPGHRTDVRSLALSSDDRMLASASAGSLKIWNIKTRSCLRSLECGYALCSIFLPGDKLVVLGTRNGSLEIFDIASSVLLDTVVAHDKDVWSIAITPDKKSLITASADKSVKFWDIRVVQESVLGTSRTAPKLRLVHTKTLKTSDDVLCVRCSPDGRLLAFSTLDSTVKVYYLDTLKLFLTLYGHKLPVLCLDISYDSKLIITSSADKNIRIWGLDFGDCHKTLFAHQDSILSVAFVPTNKDGNGHHFFSASKDRVIKYYDGDKFEQIQRISGHQGEIWSIAIARSGEFLVSASHDKSLRIWHQSDEQIFLDEEREKELEELYESTLITGLNDETDGNGDTGFSEALPASKQTTETLMAGEKITEALENGNEDLILMREYEEAKIANPKQGYPQRNPIFLANNNISASQYVYQVFSRIPSASLQDALLVLSFSQLPVLLTFLNMWTSEGRNIPLTCRILFFMIKTHQKQIVSSKLLKRNFEDVRSSLRATLRRQSHDLGFNLAGLRLTGRRLNHIQEARFEDADPAELYGEHSKQRGNKRTFVNVA